MADLGVELARGGKGQAQLVTGVTLEVLSNHLHGRSEVGRHSHLDLGGKALERRQKNPKDSHLPAARGEREGQHLVG